MSDGSITITIVHSDTGQSEALPLSGNTSAGELLEFTKALFSTAENENIALVKEGRILLQSSPVSSSQQRTLHQLGIVDGDVIAVLPRSPSVTPAPAPTSSSDGGGGGGLDFSNLLAGAAPTAAAALESVVPKPVYHDNMNLQEAQFYNPHPSSMVALLYEKEHLMKELNYYLPELAEQLMALKRQYPLSPSSSHLSNGLIDSATQLYRQSMVQSSIQNALRATTKYHEEQTMAQRMQNNPNDPEAQEYFQRQQQLQLIHEQYQHVMEEFPESVVGRVLMLYIPVKINGHALQAFCDSGAQNTIMSKKCALECNIFQYVDTRMSGIAVGVGTGKILGRIHMVQLQIQENYYFPCSITVMDDPPAADADGVQAKEMPFLLGLDMMKRHLCCLDLKEGCIRFTISATESIHVPFLHEKDLYEAQGGTKMAPGDTAPPSIG
jgi:Aspartyl protease